MSLTKENWHLSTWQWVQRLNVAGEAAVINCFLGRRSEALSTAQSWAIAIHKAVMKEEPQDFTQKCHALTLNDHHEMDMAIRMTIGADQPALLEELLVANSNFRINTHDKESVTPLMWAAQRDRLECLEVLIKHGAKLEVEDDQGCAALIKAVAHHSFSCFKALIEAGADVNHKNKRQWPPFVIALSQKNEDFAKKLLEAGARVEGAERYQSELLELLLEKCSAQILGSLVKNGLDINAKMNNEGETLLIKAARHQHLEHVREIIRLGADVSIQNNKQQNALSLLMFCENALPEIKSIVEQTPDLEERFKEGETILHIAALAGHVEAMSYLISQGADVHAVDHDLNGLGAYVLYSTPRVTRLKPRLKLLMRALDAGIDLHHQNKEGLTLLDIAKESEGRPEITKCIELVSVKLEQEAIEKCMREQETGLTVLKPSKTRTL